MTIYLENGLNAYFNVTKNCWEFRINNNLIRTCKDGELNTTINELLSEYE